MDRYDAKDMANMEVKGAPVTAFESACSIAQVVKTLVGLPIHVAIVNGLNRNAAAIVKLLHLLSLLGEVNNLEEPASPESAICIRAFALKRSTNMYRRYVRVGCVKEFGRRENKERSNGAWW